jgi:hypothetical protein
MFSMLLKACTNGLADKLMKVRVDSMYPMFLPKNPITTRMLFCLKPFFMLSEKQGVHGHVVSWPRINFQCYVKIGALRKGSLGRIYDCFVNHESIKSARILGSFLHQAPLRGVSKMALKMTDLCLAVVRSKKAD